MRFFVCNPSFVTGIGKTVFLFPLAMCALSAQCFAQSGHTMQATPVNSTGLVLLVDGSKTPASIPDQMAYRHFLIAVAEPASPTPLQADHQKVRLAPVGLSDADHAALTALLAQLRAQLDAIQQARNSADSLPSTQMQSAYAALKTQEDALIATTIGALGTTLSGNGQAQLYQYLQKVVKTKIKIYGSPGSQP